MSLIKPIHVGPVTIDAPVILAPMTGVTDLPFRKAVKRYGAGLTVSEMIASPAMIRNYDVALGTGEMSKRTSYVIARDGSITMVHSDMDWREHVAQTLAAVRALQR